MSRVKEQTGFSLHLIIAVIVGIALLGIVVWRVMDANSNQGNNTVENSQVESTEQEQSQTTEQQETVDPNEGYVVIEEWGVRFKPVDGLEGVEYSFRNDDGSTINFSVTELSKLDLNCRADNSMALGGLMRIPESENAELPSTQFLFHLGNYSYRYISPQATCSNNSDISSLQLDIYNNKFKPSIQGLELSK